jgi:hypothetical protein
MAGRGPAADRVRVRRGAPGRGEWQPTEGSGWQHSDIPAPPTGLRDSSLATWQTWFQAWWAAHWTPDDLPALRLLIRLYDRVGRGDLARLSELRQLMDSYGITPKGQQDRRWLRPEAPKPRVADTLNPYAHLRVTDGWPSTRERLRALESSSSGDRRDPRLDPLD